MNVHNLHEKKYWNNYYSHDELVKGKIKAGIFTSYDLYLCDEILQSKISLSRKTNKKQFCLCEIGSGNGKLLKKFADMFECKPYGIEYSEDAVKLSRRLGIETIKNDAFSSAVKKKYRNFFDIVFSYGFVEHIIPPEKAIQLHIDLTRPGGFFIVQIPRFRGFNYWRLLFFRPDIIAGHNLSIMDEKVLEKLCKKRGVEKIYCNNYGTFKLRIPMEKTGFKYILLKLICYSEYIFNPLFRIAFGNKGFETYFFSPAVMFIGRKRK